MGIIIDYTIKGKVKFIMFEYLKKIIQGLPVSVSVTAVIPAANLTLMVEEKLDQFHHQYVAKLLYMSR